MADQVISVRMPESLVDELKDLAQENHFLDVSEEIRSLLRTNWMEYKDPYSAKLMAIQQNVARQQVPKKIRTLKQDLTRLLEEIDEIA